MGEPLTPDERSGRATGVLTDALVWDPGIQQGGIVAPWFFRDQDVSQVRTYATQMVPAKVIALEDVKVYWNDTLVILSGTTCGLRRRVLPAAAVEEQIWSVMSNSCRACV